MKIAFQNPTKGPLITVSFDDEVAAVTQAFSLVGASRVATTATEGLATLRTAAQFAQTAPGVASGGAGGAGLAGIAGPGMLIGMFFAAGDAPQHKSSDDSVTHPTTLTPNQLRCLTNPYDTSAECAAVRSALSLIPFADSFLNNPNAARASASDQSPAPDPVGLPESATTITELRVRTPEELALRQHVRSVDDLRRHFSLHIQRVQTLGLYLFHKHPEAFPGVTEEMVREFLAFHDRTKMDDSPAFRERFWGDLAERIPVFNNHSFLEVLFAELYAFLNAATPEAAKKRCLLFIQALNDIDNRVGAAYIASLHVTNAARIQIAESLKRLEHIADCMDRHYDPVVPEEMGRTQTEQDAKQLSEYLSAPRDVLLAEELAKELEKLTGHLGFGNAALTADTITAADVEATLEEADPLATVAEGKREFLLALRTTILQYVTILDDCGSKLVQGGNPVPILATIVTQRTIFENRLQEAQTTYPFKIDSNAMDPLRKRSIYLAIEALSLAPERLYMPTGEIVAGAEENLKAILFEWPNQLSDPDSIREHVKKFLLVDRHFAITINGGSTYLRDMITLASIQAAVTLPYFTFPLPPPDLMLTFFVRLSIELNKLVTFMAEAVRKSEESKTPIVLNDQLSDVLEIMIYQTPTLIAAAKTTRGGYAALLDGLRRFLNSYSEFTGKPLDATVTRLKDRANTAAHVTED